MCMCNVDIVYSYYVFLELLWKILNICYIKNYVVPGIHKKTLFICEHAVRSSSHLVSIRKSGLSIDCGSLTPDSFIDDI